MNASPPSRPARSPRARQRPQPGRVLLVEDEPLLLRALRRSLEADGHTVLCAEGPEAAAPWLADPDLDVALVDLRLGRESGLDLLERAKRAQPDLEVIVMTGFASIETAVQAMRCGAFDYLTKPFDGPDRLGVAVAAAVGRRRLARIARDTGTQSQGSGPPLVGTSAPMRALLQTIDGLRENESCVLLQGESGTGKELVARSIHASGRRAAGAFVPVDCGALPETIMESELFGNVKGAFTGAVGAQGLFRRANGGTLFLDEIGEIPLTMQAKLLRALQEREVRPVGAAGTVPVDIRVIAATHRDLEAMVLAGRFRADLFYRLNVVRIGLPPLRDRREDIPLLVHHCIRKHRRAGSPVDGIEPDALEALVRHPWPGNVRELENVVESALALARGPRLRASDLRLGRAPGGGFARLPSAGIELSLDAYERCALERALAETGGDATRAAGLLGLGRSTLYRKLAKHGILRASEDVASNSRERDTGAAQSVR
jgi:two-component system response regulator HydG